MLPVVEDQLVAIEQRGRLQARVLHVVAFLRLVLPSPGIAAEEAGLVLAHLGDYVFLRDRHRAVVDPHLVAVGVIAVVVGIEHESNRLIGLRLDLRHDFPGAGGKVRIDYQYVIVEHHPAVVAVSFP